METCSDLWDNLTARGTAPVARFWVALEQPGPWGAKALVESDLDPALGKRLQQVVERAGGRAALIRDPLSHASGESGPRTVLVAGGGPDRQWVGRTTVADPAELVERLEDWTAGDVVVMPEWLDEAQPQLLVCTNGKRDRCCALKGRPVARALAGEFGGRVWEASHLHGHRFATTALALPSSQMVARLDEELGRRLLTEAGPLALAAENDRGRSCLTEARQVADSFLRAQLPPDDRDLLDFTGPDADGVVEVTHRTDQRTWRVATSAVALGEDLPKSCGKSPEPVVVWRADLA